MLSLRACAALVVFLLAGLADGESRKLPPSSRLAPMKQQKDRALPKSAARDYGRKGNFWINSALHTAKSIAATSALLAKSSLKASARALSGKFIDDDEIVGAWLLQHVVRGDKDDEDIVSGVTIRFLGNGTVSTRYKGATYMAPYTFTQRSWPRYCTIDFEAVTDIDRSTGKLVTMIYSGHFERSLLNSNVITLRGNIFRMQGKFL